MAVKILMEIRQSTHVHKHQCPEYRNTHDNIIINSKLNPECFGIEEIQHSLHMILCTVDGIYN